MNVIDGITVFGDADEKCMAQARDVSQNAVKVALMADNHLGYVMPIGGVAAYRGFASVVGVGFDIACGNCAILTDLKADHLADFDRKETRIELGRLADEIASTVSFGVGRKNTQDDAPVDDPLFDDPAWDALPAEANAHNLKGKARSQLGTVGSGNHYVDVFVDELGRLWVGVHFGSRGFGHTVASGFLALGTNQPWDTRVKETEVLLDLTTPLGDAYWSLMNLAGRYAYAGREWVARKVVSILGGKELEMIHNHHNFAWKETHDGEELVVIRKGATPAFPGQKGFVGGSMGDDSVILEGVESPNGPASLYSTVHGAGRVMSRTAAAGKTKGWGPKRRTIAPGLISNDMMREWLSTKGVVLRGGGLDEAPQAYRRLPDVLAAQGETIRVLHTLRPLIVVMAGADVEDPFKD